MFNKINQELYVLINNNKFVNINLRLSHEAKIKMYIKIFNLMSHVTFQFFLSNYRIIVFLKNKSF